MKRAALASLLVVVAFALAGCGADPTPGEASPPPADRAARFAGILSPDGLSLGIDGLSATFPPGAVSESVEIEIDPIEPPAALEGATGRWFRFQPSGLTFDAPVVLRLDEVAEDEVIAKWVDGDDPDGRATGAVQTLPQVTLGSGARAVELGGFSRVGRLISLARDCPTRVDRPAVDIVATGACNPSVEVSWASGRTVWIELGYRPGTGAPTVAAPVEPVAIWPDRPAQGRLTVPLSSLPPLPTEQVTIFARAYNADLCDGRVRLTPPATASVVVARPRSMPAPKVEARRASRTVELTWTLTASAAAGVDSFDIARQPAWSDGLRTAPGDARRFRDTEATPDVAYRYRVRTRQRVEGCVSDRFGEWGDVRVSRAGVPPGGDRATRTCQFIALEVEPAEQTVTAQTEACRQLGACPDAQLAFSARLTDGRPLPPAFVNVFGPDVLQDLGLVTIESPDLDGPVVFGASFARLVDPAGMALTYSAQVSVRVPTEAVQDVSLPTTWRLSIGLSDCKVDTLIHIVP